MYWYRVYPPRRPRPKQHPTTCVRASLAARPDPAAGPARNREGSQMGDASAEHRAEEPSGCLAGKQSATPKLKEESEVLSTSVAPAAAEAQPGHPFAPWQLGLMQERAEPVRAARAWQRQWLADGCLSYSCGLRRGAQRSRTSRRGSSASGCCERARERAGCQLDTRGRPSDPTLTTKGVWLITHSRLRPRAAR